MSEIKIVVATAVRWTEYDTGGHFASLQAPVELVADVRAFVADLDLG